MVSPLRGWTVGVDLCQARRTTVETTAPTLLLAIDQFEELLTAAARSHARQSVGNTLTPRPSAQQFLRFLRPLLSRSNGRLLVIGTMRSDYLDTYEQHAESLKPPFLELYRLPPFPWERVTDIITRAAKHSLEPIDYAAVQSRFESTSSNNLAALSTNNGLNVEENRRCFKAPHIAEAIYLVLNGLTTVAAKG